MDSTINYINYSNNNKYTYKYYKEQILIERYDNYDNNHSCLGDMTSKCTPNTFDKFYGCQYANKTRFGNNHIWLPQKDIEFYLNYIKEMFPIFKWKFYQAKQSTAYMVLELIFIFDHLVDATDCNRMKLIFNLTRRIYETPRSYQLKHALTLYKEKWHNLDLYQLLLLAELTEYSSTNDHKLISNLVSILPTKEEVVKRTSEVTGIFNSNRLACETKSGEFASVSGLPYSFSNYPTELTDPLRKQFEYLFILTNKRRKFLNLNEL